MEKRGAFRMLVLGATGMLGSTLYRYFSALPEFETFGTIRDGAAMRHFVPDLHRGLLANINLESDAGLLGAFYQVRPDIVINCVGIIKQLPNANDYLESLSINAMLPHRIARFASLVGARLVHFSTDCVFSGKTGLYTESSFPDAYDVYGRTKFLGEVDYVDAITLRTSIIGHELSSKKSLIDWFLSQEGEVKGFTEAVFSGLPTIEIARVVKEYVLPNPELHGLYHLSVDPIDKYALLQLVADVYKKDILITPDDQLTIDRSLDSQRFRAATGFMPKRWSDLVCDMHHDFMEASGSR